MKGIICVFIVLLASSNTVWAIEWKVSLQDIAKQKQTYYSPGDKIAIRDYGIAVDCEIEKPKKSVTPEGQEIEDTYNLGVNCAYLGSPKFSSWITCNDKSKERENSHWNVILHDKKGEIVYVFNAICEPSVKKTKESKQ